MDILISEKHAFKVGDSQLSCILEKPELGIKSAILVLHPHPLYGGDMFNPVVSTLADTFREVGFATLRFNFRGVDSRSEYSGIPGAIDDTVAASELLEQLDFKLAGVAGYSFGGSTALRFSSQYKVDCVVSISSSLDLIQEGSFSATQLSKISCPVLMLHGSSDLTVPYENMTRISSYLQSHTKCVAIENEGHFYHHSLKRVHAEVKIFMENQWNS